MFSILLLLIAICVVRFFYFLLFKKRDIIAAIRYACTKQIIIITFSLVIVFFAYAKIAKYDTVINSKKTCEKVVKYIENDDYKKIYKLLSKYLKNKYSLNDFSNLIIEVKTQNNCINFKCIKVSSNDKSGLKLSNCNNSTDILEITFSGGWGFGWEIIEILNSGAV